MIRIGPPGPTLFHPNPQNMKLPLPLGGGFLAAGACLTIAGTSFAAESDIPHGTLAVDHDYVRVGAKSQLAWQIDYPAPVTSRVEIVPPNILSPKTDLTLKARILGASLQLPGKNNNGGGNNLDSVDGSNPKTLSDGYYDPSGTVDDERNGVIATCLPMELMWSLNGAPWTRIFYGDQTLVNPSNPILETTVKTDDRVYFGAHGWSDNAWMPFYHTGQTTPNVIVLKKGDNLFTAVPHLANGMLESFLKPYVDSVSGTVRIGERDLIVFMELDQSVPSKSGFDLQDLVLLVTVE